MHCIRRCSVEFTLTTHRRLSPGIRAPFFFGQNVKGQRFITENLVFFLKLKCWEELDAQLGLNLEYRKKGVEKPVQDMPLEVVRGTDGFSERCSISFSCTPFPCKSPRTEKKTTEKVRSANAQFCCGCITNIRTVSKNPIKRTDIRWARLDGSKNGSSVWKILMFSTAQLLVDGSGAKQLHQTDYVILGHSTFHQERQAVGFRY